MVVQKEDYAVFLWCSAPEYIIELVCDVITLKMDALSKQLHQAPFFGQDTDVIYLHSCDLNTKFDFTVPSVQFLWLNVVFGQFVFVGSLVKRRQHMLPATGEFWINSTAWDFHSLYRLWRKFKRKLSFRFVGKGKLFIMKLFFEEFNLICFTGSAWPLLKCNQGSDVLENFEVHFLLYVQGNYFFKRKFMYL